jgi:hypothetical protein
MAGTPPSAAVARQLSITVPRNTIAALRIAGQATPSSANCSQTMKT